jgi:broad-specificity NMP kinase
MVPAILDNKGTKILAKSLFKELRGNGYSTNQILSLSTELIDLVTQDLKDEHAQAAAAAQAAVANEVAKAASEARVAM